MQTHKTRICKSPLYLQFSLWIIFSDIKRRLRVDERPNHQLRVDKVWVSAQWNKETSRPSSRKTTSHSPSGDTVFTVFYFWIYFSYVFFHPYVQLWFHIITAVTVKTVLFSAGFLLSPAVPGNEPHVCVLIKKKKSWSRFTPIFILILIFLW